MFAKFQVAWMHCPAAESHAAARSGAAAIASAASFAGADGPARDAFVWGGMPQDKDKFDKFLPKPDGSLVRIADSMSLVPFHPSSAKLVFISLAKPCSTRTLHILHRIHPVWFAHEASLWNISTTEYAVLWLSQWRNLILSLLQIHLYVAGPGINYDASELRHAGGEQKWTVACKCGVTDDDGERMLCCDGCGSWHHAFCMGIPDSEPDPKSFLCEACEGKALRRSSHKVAAWLCISCCHHACLL
jgi:PHD-finger